MLKVSLMTSFSRPSSGGPVRRKWPSGQPLSTQGKAPAGNRRFVKLAPNFFPTTTQSSQGILNVRLEEKEFRGFSFCKMGNFLFFPIMGKFACKRNSFFAKSAIVRFFPIIVGKDREIFVS